MTILTLAHSSINKKANFFSFPKINWKTYCLCGFLISLSLAILYVFGINHMIQGSYLIKEYQRQIETLSKENKVLEADFAKTSFMGTIREKTQAMSFEKVKKVKYMQILETSAFLPKEGRNNN